MAILRPGTAALIPSALLLIFNSFFFAVQPAFAELADYPDIEREIEDATGGPSTGTLIVHICDRADKPEGLVCGTGTHNPGVIGRSESATAVEGTSESATGVSGSSAEGFGLRGFSSGGTGVIGISDSADGSAGLFLNTDDGDHVTAGDPSDPIFRVKNNGDIFIRTRLDISAHHANTFVGYRSGRATTGENNTFIGQDAGRNNNTGQRNTFLGEDSGKSNTTGSRNTFIGENAGYSNDTGSRNVFIGRNAGFNETGSDRLYIDNSDTERPLIHGDFAGDIVSIHGRLVIRKPSDGTALLELGEGLDYAEGFDVTDSDQLSPGSVVIIDPQSPGKLTMSTTAYDKKVAGIVSGGGGLASGIRLGADAFNNHVALAGRVYCNVEATVDSITPGDLLTTSDMPGYAKKAADHDRAPGAILGKAMEPLAFGQTGKILVLVTLQ